MNQACEIVEEKVNTVSRIQKALILRKISNVRTDMHKVRRVKKVMDFCNKRILKSGKVIRLVNTDTYKTKIEKLLRVAEEQGVADLAVAPGYGGYLRLSGRFGKAEVSGHFWADSRGPVLDIYQGEYSNLSTSLLMRLKFFKNVLVYNRALDKVLGDTTRIKQPRAVLAFVQEVPRSPRYKAVPASSCVMKVQV